MKTPAKDEKKLHIIYAKSQTLNSELSKKERKRLKYSASENKTLPKYFCHDFQW